MIRKLLICTLLVQFSNANNIVRNPNTNETIDTSSYESFKTTCLESGFSTGVVMSKSRVCIPGWIKWMLYAPGWNLINIEMINIQVIEIDMHGLTMRLHLTIEWEEYRIILFRNTSSIQKYFLDTDEQKEIWSPQIGIRTRMVSQNEQGLGFGVFKTSGWRWPWVSRKVDLTTKVKCPMNFQNFPFDNHSCKLEVSWYLVLKLIDFSIPIL